jgi:hypothetical protein
LCLIAELGYGSGGGWAITIIQTEIIEGMYIKVVCARIGGSDGSEFVEDGKAVIVVVDIVVAAVVTTAAIGRREPRR